MEQSEKILLKIKKLKHLVMNRLECYEIEIKNMKNKLNEIEKCNIKKQNILNPQSEKFTINLDQNNGNSLPINNIVSTKKMTNQDIIKMIIMNQLNQKSKQSQQEPNSMFDDDEYDDTFDVFDKEKNNIPNDFIDFSGNIKSIDDLIKIGEKYCEMNDIEKNSIPNRSINFETIAKLVKPLKKLNRMIGIKEIKNEIYEMVIYYLQDFEKNNDAMLHTIITGPPGVGKTCLGKILAEIYCALGIISNSKFKYVRATDLIGDHVGATKHMTQNVIDESDGGVLFIDEAYALSTDEKKDPYGKECLDTLNFNLSENKKKLIVIIAGYSDQLENHFFAYNQGLARRFTFRLNIKEYSSDELKDIFIEMLKKNKWKLDNSIDFIKLSNFFKIHKDDFSNFGGDIETFIKKCQYSHSKRVIGKHINIKKKLNNTDIENGLIKFNKTKKQCDMDIYKLNMYV
jgi:SpoVK/Ycf46/Vps4 family AAA+-type ATPase